MDTTETPAGSVAAWLDHKVWCPTRYATPQACSCGLDALRAKVALPSEPRP